MGKTPRLKLNAVNLGPPISLELISRKLKCLLPTTTPHHALLHLHQNLEWTTPPRETHPVRYLKEFLTAHFPHNHLQQTNPPHPPTTPPHLNRCPSRLPRGRVRGLQRNTFDQDTVPHQPLETRPERGICKFTTHYVNPCIGTTSPFADHYRTYGRRGIRVQRRRKVRRRGGLTSDGWEEEGSLSAGRGEEEGNREEEGSQGKSAGRREGGQRRSTMGYKRNYFWCPMVDCASGPVQKMGQHLVKVHKMDRATAALTARKKMRSPLEAVKLKLPNPSRRSSGMRALPLFFDSGSSTTNDPTTSKTPQPSTSKGPTSNTPSRTPSSSLWRHIPPRLLQPPADPRGWQQKRCNSHATCP